MEISFFCAPSDREEIVNLIHMQKNKSTNLMNIPVFIYKILATIISTTVSMLFNNSVSEGIFPECFKMDKIIPIFKSGDSNSMNYKPISMLPFLSKIFEKLVCARLDSYLKSNNILCTNQFGFRKKIKYFKCNYWIPWLCLFIVGQQAEHHCCISRFLRSIQHS